MPTQRKSKQGRRKLTIGSNVCIPLKKSCIEILAFPSTFFLASLSSKTNPASFDMAVPPAVYIRKNVISGNNLDMKQIQTDLS